MQQVNSVPPDPFITTTIKTDHCDARTSAGVHIGNLTHQDVAIFGAGGGQGTTFYGQVNGTSLVLSGAVSCTTLTASGKITGDDLEVGYAPSGYTAKFTYGGGAFQLGTYSNRALQIYTNSALAATFGTDGSLTTVGAVYCTTLAALQTVAGAVELGAFRNLSSSASAYTQVSFGNDTSSVSGYIYLNSSTNTGLAGAGSINFGGSGNVGLIAGGAVRATLTPTLFSTNNVSCASLTSSGGTMTVPSATQVIAAAGKVYAGDTSATSIQTEGGITIASAQYIYIRGDAATDGSVRFSSQAAGTMSIERRTSGTWTVMGSFA